MRRPAQVYLGQRGAWLRVATGEPAIEFEAEHWQAAMTQVFAHLQTEVPRQRRAKLWLSGALAQPFMLAPVPGLRDRQEAQRMAQARASEETGLGGPCAVWLDAWQADASSLAVAVNHAVIEATAHAASQAGLRLMGIEPAWNEVLTQRLSTQHEVPRLLAIEEADALTMLGTADGKIVFAQSQSPAPERLGAQLQRVAMSRDVPAEALLLASVKGLDAGVAQTQQWLNIQWREGAGL